MMPDLKYQPVAHDHQTFLARAATRKGFAEAYDALVRKYRVISRMYRVRAGITGHRQPTPRKLIANLCALLCVLYTVEARALACFPDPAAEQIVDVVITHIEPASVGPGPTDAAALQPPLRIHFRVITVRQGLAMFQGSALLQRDGIAGRLEMAPGERFTLHMGSAQMAAMGMALVGQCSIRPLPRAS